MSNLRQTAEQRTQAWDALAKTLESRIAGLLPCDPKIVAAVAEVSRASDARTAAFNDYFRAVSSLAAADTAAARALASASGFASLDSLDRERAESAEERTGIEIQISDLASSARTRPELAAAEADLRATVALIDRRNMLVTQLDVRKDARAEAVRNLVAQTAAREAALQELVTAHANESAKWSAYYAARMERSRAECTAINPGAAPRPRARVNRKGESQVIR